MFRKGAHWIFRFSRTDNEMGNIQNRHNSFYAGWWGTVGEHPSAIHLEVYSRICRERHCAGFLFDWHVKHSLINRRVFSLLLPLFWKKKSIFITIVFTLFLTFHIPSLLTIIATIVFIHFFSPHTHTPHTFSAWAATKSATEPGLLSTLCKPTTRWSSWSKLLKLQFNAVCLVFCFFG